MKNSIRNQISGIFKPLVKARLKEIDEKLNKEYNKEVAIVLLEKMGDIIVSTPIIHHYKKLGYKVCYICSKKYQWVIKDNPEIDDYILIPDYSVKNIIGRIMNRQVWFVLKNKVEKSPRFKKSIFLSIYPESTIDKYKDCLIEIYAKKAGITLTKKRPIIKLGKENKELIKKYKLKSKGYICIGYTASTKEKTWPLKNFMILAKNFRSIYPKYKVIFIGGRDDPKVSLKDEKIIWINGEKLWNVAYLIKNSKAFIGLDSGLIHIASAFNIPIIRIYSGLEPQKMIGPLSNKKIQICSKNKRIDSIKIEEVFQAFKSLIFPTT